MWSNLNSKQEEVNTMTLEQVKWASEHDWFITYTTNNGIYGVIAKDDYSIDGKLHSKDVDFTDFKELRIWAGY